MTAALSIAIPANNRHKRLPFNANAFFAALILAPIWVTLLSCWTIISLFALPMGAPAYLIVGTPALLWATGWMYPGFGNYAFLGCLMNFAAWALCLSIFGLRDGLIDTLRWTTFYFGFGGVFAPLYAGAFGYLYARWHPTLKPS